MDKPPGRARLERDPKLMVQYAYVNFCDLMQFFEIKYLGIASPSVF